MIRMLIYRGYNSLSDLTVDIEKGLKVFLPKNALSYIIYYLYSISLSAKVPVHISITAEGGTLTLRLNLSEEISDRIIGVQRRMGNFLHLILILILIYINGYMFMP